MPFQDGVEERSSTLNILERTRRRKTMLWSQNLAIETDPENTVMVELEEQGLFRN